MLRDRKNEDSGHFRRVFTARHVLLEEERKGLEGLGKALSMQQVVLISVLTCNSLSSFVAFRSLLFSSSFSVSSLAICDS